MKDEKGRIEEREMRVDIHTKTENKELNLFPF